MSTTPCVDEEVLLAFATQALDAAQAAEVAAHVSQCSDCRMVLAEIGRGAAMPPMGVTPAPPLRAGMVLGRYVLGACVGVGGMGAVYEAFDPRLERRVALKVLRDLGDEHPERAARFERERLIQASLAHPHIARLLDGGQTDDGRAYLVLDFIEGVPIDEYCDTHRLSTRERLALFRVVCEAVHFAHQNLVVHRDLKPSNILVTKEGQPMLVDFGIAKLLEDERGGPTSSGVQPMTPAYASPEQVAHEPPTTATDIYSLGVVLHVLLTGQSPYRLETRALDELLRAVNSQEPEPLSEVVLRAPREAVQCREQSLERLRGALRGDVDAVVRMALRKRPAGRYASAERLAEDLRCVLEARPTSARRGSWRYRARLFLRRNTAAVAALSAAVVALTAGGATTLWQANVAQRARENGTRDALEAARLAADAEQMQEAMRVEMLLPPHDLTPARERIRQTLTRLEDHPSPMARAAAAFTQGRAHQLLGDDAKAYELLLRAWQLGFQRPEVARALALCESRLAERELALLGWVDDPARRQVLVGERTQRFRQAATERLRVLEGASNADRLLLSARFAWLDQRWSEAADLAAQALAQGADPLETSELVAEAKLSTARDLFDHADEGARASTEAAIVAAEQAIAIGRSSPRPLLLLIRLKVYLFDMDAAAHGFPMEPLDAMVELLHRAEALDPSSAEVHIVWSVVDKRRGDAALAAARESRPDFERAVSHAERAVAKATFDPRFPLLQVASAAYALALALANEGSDALPAVERGIEAARRAEQLAPGASGPLYNLAQLTAYRAWLKAQAGVDSRAAAAEGVAAARRFVELEEQPVLARVTLSQALDIEADANWLMGGDADAAFSAAVATMREVVALAPKDLKVLFEGVVRVNSWASHVLPEGRAPDAALAEALAWATELEPLSKSNVVFAGHVGTLHLMQARAELLRGHDPSAWLAKAAPLLSRMADRDSVCDDMLAEVELARAEWAVLGRRDASPALRAAVRHARAAQALDPTDADAWRLEARALVGLRARTPEESQRALLAANKAVEFGRHSGAAHLVLARARAASGDLSGAREAVEKAAGLQPRLVELATVRAEVASD